MKTTEAKADSEAVRRMQQVIAKAGSRITDTRDGSDELLCFISFVDPALLILTDSKPNLPGKVPELGKLQNIANWRSSLKIKRRHSFRFQNKLRVKIGKFPLA